MTRDVLPLRMRAWQYKITSKGGLDQRLKLNPYAHIPIAKGNEHFVQILAMALNPVDYKPTEVPLFGRFLVSYPATPGLDYVGLIIVPAHGSPLKARQLVFGVAGTNYAAGGAMAEYAVVAEKHAIPVPEGVSYLDAAGIGLAALTAYQSIVPRVKEGDRIFINGGSGGVGTFGIQIAKVVGCHVTTTCSTANVDLCKSLGADEVIDYKKGSVYEALLAGEKFDHAIDLVGHIKDKALWWRCHKYMKPDASYILVAGDLTLPSAFDMAKRSVLPRFLGGIKGKVEGFRPTSKPEDLERVAAWVQEEKIDVIVDSVFDIEEGADAVAKLKTCRAQGKIVVHVAAYKG